MSPRALALRAATAGMIFSGLCAAQSPRDRPATPAVLQSQARGQICAYFGVGSGLLFADSSVTQAEAAGLPRATAAALRGEILLRYWRFAPARVNLLGQARFRAREALTADRESAAAYALLGFVESAEGCPSCAYLRSQQALHYDANGAQGMLLRALAYAGLGEAEVTDQWLSRALAAETQPACRADMLSLVSKPLLEKGRIDPAERYLNQTLKLTEDVYARAWFGARIAQVQLFYRGQPGAASVTAAEPAKRGIAYAKRVLDMAAYLEWARRYLRNGADAAGYQQASVTGYLAPGDAFVEAASYAATAEVTRALLRAKAVADVNVKDLESNTALIAAARGNNLVLAKELVGRGADLNAQNDRSERALGHFVRAGNIEGVQFLLTRGAAVNYVDGTGRAPLTLAVGGKNPRMLAVLFKAGAKLAASGPSSGGDFAVMAAGLGDLETLKLLHAHGVGVNAIDGDGQSALVAAAIAGQTEIVKYLLAKKSDPELRYLGGTALDYARAYGNTELVRLLEAARRQMT